MNPGSSECFGLGRRSNTTGGKIEQPHFYPHHPNLSLGPRGPSDNFHLQDPHRPLALGKARWGSDEYFGAGQQLTAHEEGALEHLYKPGPDPFKVAPYGASSHDLFVASRQGQLEVVKRCLKDGNEVNMIDGFLWNPLCWACRNGHLKIAKFLIKKGADVNHIVTLGHTPLILSALRGDLPMVQTLVKAGAELDTEDYDGLTALDWAIKWDSSRRNWTVTQKKGVYGGQTKSMAPNQQPNTRSVAEYLVNVGAQEGSGVPTPGVVELGGGQRTFMADPNSPVAEALAIEEKQ